MMKSIVMIVLCLLTAGRTEAQIRWGSSFTEKYRSEADSADITFGVRTPPQVAGRKSYPLIVVLNGGPRVPPSKSFPYFQVRPSRGRIWGYRSMSAYDAMQVIAFMKQNYPIDPDRVYLVGSSAGGSGAMHLASCYPDQFAAVLPLIAAGNNYPLRNFFNLPVAFHHDDRDWTSAICNARVQTQRLQESGSPSFLKEYAGAGHGVPGSHEPMMTWLFEQRGNPAPPKIKHDCEAPSLGRSYWLKIDEFLDPHQRATVDAEIIDDTVSVTPTNIAAFSLDLDLIDATTVRIDGTDLPLGKHYRIQDGHWQTSAPPTKPRIRAYEAGSAANLYQGEPLIIVYGTGGDQTGLLRAAAMKLAAYGGPVHSTLRRHFPVVADTELTAELQARCNLILIGRPDDNIITKKLRPRLPITLNDETLAVADRPPLGLQNRILTLLHPNPEHPDRLICVLSPFADDTTAEYFSTHPQLFLPGSDGFDRVSQPDLIVQDIKHRIAHQIQFTKDYAWLKLPGSETPIPPQFSKRENLALVCMELMRNRSNADFALWWGPADKGMWGADFNYLQQYDPDSYTLADYRTQHRVSETMLGSVSGRELKEIHSRWCKNRELLSIPEINVADINDEAQYRLHIPMDLYIKLGQRKKNLDDPSAGPSFTTEELIPGIFSNAGADPP